MLRLGLLCALLAAPVGCPISAQVRRASALDSVRVAVDHPTCQTGQCSGYVMVLRANGELTVAKEFSDTALQVADSVVAHLLALAHPVMASTLPARIADSRVLCDMRWSHGRRVVVDLYSGATVRQIVDSHTCRAMGNRPMDIEGWLPVLRGLRTFEEELEALPGMSAWLRAVMLGGEGTEADCDRPLFSRTCALRAAGIADLAGARVGPHERELRYWITSGTMFPEKLVILRQFRDSVSGRVLLLWPARMMASPAGWYTCNDEWSNASAAVCSGRPAAPPDWSSIIRQLDDAGLSTVPNSPVSEQYCDRTPIPTPRSEPDRLPVDRLCPLVLGGFTEVLEVRTEAGYWRYQFPSIPDSLATGRKRDQALLAILRRAARLQGEILP